MSGPIRIDPGELQTIATACRSSSENMSTEATRLRSQIDHLHDALQGVPSLAAADHFQELIGVLSRLSEALDQSNRYLTDVVTKVNEFVGSLGQH